MVLFLSFFFLFFFLPPFLSWQGLSCVAPWTIGSLAPVLPIPKCCDYRCTSITPIFCSAGWTQDFRHARQTHYSLKPSPMAASLDGGMALVEISAQWQKKKNQLSLGVNLQCRKKTIAFSLVHIASDELWLTTFYSVSSFKTPLKYYLEDGASQSFGHIMSRLCHSYRQCAIQHEAGATVMRAKRLC